MSTDLRERILVAARAEPSATRPALQRRALAGYALASLGCWAIFASMGGIGHAAGRPASVTWILAAGGCAIAAAALAFGTWRGRSAAGRPARVLAVSVFAVPLATFAWLVAWSGSYVEPFYRFGWRCLGITLGCGALIAAVSFGLRWRSVAVNAGWHGAALAAGAGAAGGVVVDLWCPLTNAPHVVVGHVAPIVLLTVAGALAGRAALAVRARRP